MESQNMKSASPKAHDNVPTTIAIEAWDTELLKTCSIVDESNSNSAYTDTNIIKTNTILGSTTSSTPVFSPIRTSIPAYEEIYKTFSTPNTYKLHKLLKFHTLMRIDPNPYADIYQTFAVENRPAKYINEGLLPSNIQAQYIQAITNNPYYSTLYAWHNNVRPPPPPPLISAPNSPEYKKYVKSILSSVSTPPNLRISCSLPSTPHLSSKKLNPKAPIFLSQNKVDLCPKDITQVEEFEKLKSILQITHINILYVIEKYKYEYNKALCLVDLPTLYIKECNAFIDLCALGVKDIIEVIAGMGSMVKLQDRNILYNEKDIYLEISKPCKNDNQQLLQHLLVSLMADAIHSGKFKSFNHGDISNSLIAKSIPLQSIPVLWYLKYGTFETLWRLLKASFHESLAEFIKAHLPLVSIYQFSDSALYVSIFPKENTLNSNLEEKKVPPNPTENTSENQILKELCHKLQGFQLDNQYLSTPTRKPLKKEDDSNKSESMHSHISCIRKEMHRSCPCTNQMISFEQLKAMLYKVICIACDKRASRWERGEDIIELEEEIDLQMVEKRASLKKDQIEVENINAAGSVERRREKKKAKKERKKRKKQKLRALEKCEKIIDDDATSDDENTAMDSMINIPSHMNGTLESNEISIHEDIECHHILSQSSTPPYGKYLNDMDTKSFIYKDSTTLSQQLLFFRNRNLGILVSCLKNEWNRIYVENPNTNEQYYGLGVYMGYYNIKKVKYLLMETPNLLLIGIGGRMRVSTVQNALKYFNFDCIYENHCLYTELLKRGLFQYDKSKPLNDQNIYTSTKLYNMDIYQNVYNIPLTITLHSQEDIFNDSLLLNPCTYTPEPTIQENKPIFNDEAEYTDKALHIENQVHHILKELLELLQIPYQKESLEYSEDHSKMDTLKQYLDTIYTYDQSRQPGSTSNTSTSRAKGYLLRHFYGILDQECNAQRRNKIHIQDDNRLNASLEHHENHMLLKAKALLSLPREKDLYKHLFVTPDEEYMLDKNGIMGIPLSQLSMIEPSQGNYNIKELLKVANFDSVEHCMSRIPSFRLRIIKDEIYAILLPHDSTSSSPQE